MSFNDGGGGIWIWLGKADNFGGINLKGEDFLQLFSDYFFIGGWSLGWSDLLKWRVTFVDRKSGIITGLGGISVLRVMLLSP